MATHERGGPDRRVKRPRTNQELTRVVAQMKAIHRNQKGSLSEEEDQARIATIIHLFNASYVLPKRYAAIKVDETVDADDRK